MRRILSNTRIVDGTGQVLPEEFIVVEGGSIADIRPMSDFPDTPDGEVVDVAGRTVRTISTFPSGGRWTKAWRQPRPG